VDDILQTAELRSTKFLFTLHKQQLVKRILNVTYQTGYWKFSSSLGNS